MRNTSAMIRAALIAMSANFGFNGDKILPKTSIPRSQWRRPGKTYKPNQGMQAAARYHARIQAGKIPEDQILRGVRS